MTDTTSPTKSRGKFRAILAGGLVLGVGAAVVLAAWNDSEFAIGTFGAGSFNMEGSTDGAAFAEHATADAAGALTFTVDPENLAPGDAVYAPFAARLDGETTTDANVVVGPQVTTGNVTGLTYELIATEVFGCDADSTGDPLVPAGTALGTTPDEVSFDLIQGADPAPGTPVNLCFKVTAGDTLTQGQTASTTWSFVAESQ